MLKHEEQEQLIDKILDAFDVNIQEALILVERALNNILLKKGISEQTALDFQLDFIAALEEAGYYAKVNDFIDNRFDELFLSIREGFKLGGLTVKYTQDDLTKIAALKNLQLNQFNSLANESATIIQKNLYKYVLGGASLVDIQTTLSNDLVNTNLFKHSTTLARTSIADFQQSVIDIKAQGLDGVWLYVGVKDSKNRDYCRCILDKNNYFTDEQKSKVASNPARRYNCRHRLRPVSLEFAEKEGYKPTERLSCGS